MSPTHRDLPTAPPSVRSYASSPRPRHIVRLTLNTFFLSLLLFTSILSGWGFSLPYAVAAGRPHAAPANMTFKQFLQQAASDRAHRTPFVRPQQVRSLPLARGEHGTNPAQLPPSAEPATMQPITQVLAASFLSGGAGTKPLDLVGSDQRIEVLLQPAAFDFSHATTSKGALTATTTVTLKLTQTQGRYVGESILLGTYALQVFDTAGNLIQGVTLRSPLTVVYHYQPQDLLALHLDPARLSVTWPSLTAAARRAHQPVSAFTSALHNDSRAHTLTGQSLVIDTVHPFDIGGNASVQTPPTPLFASTQGNSGALTYSYPIETPPGPAGFGPKLTLAYSSDTTNERDSIIAPANNVGDGWALTMSSISASAYPSGSASTVPIWYFLNNVANVSDRLVQDATVNGEITYQSEHLSHLRIHKLGGTGINGCFHVWDTSGNYYEYGCTTDSLQYYNDALGTHYYRYDLNKMVAVNEGPGSASVSKTITVTYLQDAPTIGGSTSVRDAAIKRIVYSQGSTTVGTVDFFYYAPSVPSGQSAFAKAYSDFGSNYNCASPPPNGNTTSIRCDDPINSTGGLAAPTVMSTLTLHQVTSYVGDDSTLNNAAYQYTFTYHDTPFSPCYNLLLAQTMFCAGYHTLSQITPTVYQSGTANALKPVIFGYATLYNTYSDQTQTVSDGSKYAILTNLPFLVDYLDTNTGVGGHITYNKAYNNTHGTPDRVDGSGNVDDRHDPFYCTSFPADCSPSPYSHPDDHAWTREVVTQIQTWGVDSSALTSPTITNYAYRLHPTSTGCPADARGNTDCLSDNWLPIDAGNNHQDGDWVDFYHGEYRGFEYVYTLSPANDLTSDQYFTTDGWFTNSGFEGNYNAGQLIEEDVYRGPQALGSALLRKTYNTFTGRDGNTNSCDGALNLTYTACIAMILTSTTTLYEGLGSGTTNPPSVEHDYTYDDYTTTGGLNTGGYHNLTEEDLKISTSSSPSTPYLKQKWTYSPNNQTVGTQVYYDVNKVTHSEVDDPATGHVWSCQDMAYDEGSSASNPKPAQGLPTTITTYSDCANQSTTAIKNYKGYDALGNLVATVDGVGTANSSLYGSGGKIGYNGCTLATAPVVLPTWSAGTYTSCSVYDTYGAQPTSATNALGQHTNTQYDYHQGALPTQVSDVNNQATTTTYSYSSGNRTVQISQPGEPNSQTYTSQSSTHTTCPATLLTAVLTPCFEIDANTQQYNTVQARTFYDGLGRAVETRTPGPGSNDTIAFTVYNDGNHTVFKSVPFQVSRGSSWIDPNNAIDPGTGHSPAGTTTFSDALNRVFAVIDPAKGSGGDGIACSTTPPVTNTYTSCINYSLGNVSAYTSDTHVYGTATSVDANNHVALTYSDPLGRTVYVLTDSGGGPTNGTLTANALTSIQYNLLDKPTQVTVTDLAPKANQTVTSVTTTAQYDDLGRLTSLVDPDRGTHTYSYDADGHSTADVSGTRTIGVNYDLLGRVGCVQDALPTSDADGSCTAGTHPYVQNTYDTTANSQWLGSDYPIGRLTQSVATTTYPDTGSPSVTTTESMQYDQRGRMVTQQLNLGLPSSWNVSPALPTYQLAVSYNDANQPVTTTTSTLNPTGTGYTTTQVYDATGNPSGLSNNGNLTPNLATLSYNSNALLSGINFLTSDGSSALANEQFTYDGNLRPSTTTATWQSGSGATGQIFTQTRSYDAASNVTSLLTTHAAVPGQTGSGGSETQNYCYDEQNRLVWAGNSGTQPGAGNGTCGSGTLGNTLSGASYTNTFVYTHLGQLWQGPLNGSSTSYQYFYCDSGPHQLSGLYSAGTTCANKSGQLYKTTYSPWGDATGRTYQGTLATLSNDGLDHLVKWGIGGGNNEYYAYDVSGNRVVRRTNNSGTTTMTVYAFGLEEHVYSGTGTIQNNTYYYSLAGRLIGELTGTTPSTSIFLTDALGSVLTTFSNAAGTAKVLANQVYGPYGTQRYSSGTMGTAKGFTGQYNDPFTGLDYYNARYYDPAVGVFLSADKVQGNPQGVNPYTYVQGNPETMNDPTGQCIHDPENPYCGGGGDSSDGPPPPSGGGGPTQAPPLKCGSGTTQVGSTCVSTVHCGPGTVLQGNTCVSGPDHTKAKNEARHNQLFPALLLSIAELVGGGFILMLIDMLAIKQGVDKGDVPMVISSLGEFLGLAAEIASALSVGFPAISGIAYGLTAVLHGFLAIASGVLWAYNAVMGGAKWLKGVYMTVLQTIGIAVQGAPGLLFNAAKVIFGKLVFYGGRALGQAIMAEGATGVAVYASETSMNVDDWCAQYGRGVAACATS